MAKETEDRIWAQTSFLLTDDPPAPGDSVNGSGLTSVTRTALGTYAVVIDNGIADAEEVLSLCTAPDAKAQGPTLGVVEKTGPTAYTIRTFDTANPAGAIDTAVGFTIKRIRHAL